MINGLKGLAKMALIPLALSLGNKRGEYNGHMVTLEHYPLENHSQMVIHSKDSDGALIAIDKNCNGEFDQIFLKFKKGNELEKYVSIDSLDKIAKYINEHGEDTQ